MVKYTHRNIQEHSEEVSMVKGTSTGVAPRTLLFWGGRSAA